MVDALYGTMSVGDIDPLDKTREGDTEVTHDVEAASCSADIPDMALMLLMDEGDSGPVDFFIERSVNSDFISARE